MVGDVPDEQLFREVVDPLIVRAKGVENERRVRAFGEMVSLLFVTNPTAALCVENFWNTVVEREGICLLCTYDLRDSGQATLSPNLCAAHSHAIA
jgi:hypothetical protein